MTTTETPLRERPLAPLPARSPRRTGRRALMASFLALGLLAVGCSDSDADDDRAAGTSEITQLDDHDDHAVEDKAVEDQADDDDGRAEDPDAGGSGGAVRDGVPKECSIYPFALEPADPDEITLTPDTWPAPPSGATLCVTSATLGGSTEVAEYALGADAETILGYYEAQLGEAWNLAREAGIGTGEILTGYDDAVGFQIVPREGGFRIAFGEL